MRIYVTNLLAEVTDEDLKAHFEVAGEVSLAMVVRTKTTNESTGFGFVDMADKAAALQAYKLLEGKPLKGNPLKLYDRRDALERRGGLERRTDFDRRVTVERRDFPRRIATGEEEIVSLFVDLDRRTEPERRIDANRRYIPERRAGEERRVEKDRRFPFVT